MAKQIGTKERQLREMREGKAEGDGGLFDLDAYQSELTKLREKHLSGVRNRISELEEQRKGIEVELDRLNKLEAQITGRTISAGKATGTRTRRSREELENDAKQIVSFLEKNPGTTGPDIKSRTGIDYGLSLPKFLEQYAKAKVKTEGPRNQQTYTIA